VTIRSYLNGVKMTRTTHARAAKTTRPARKTGTAGKARKPAKTQDRAPRKANYHHGNLREALVAGAIRVLEEEGIAALSLRRVAKESGVSQAAPYAHFADKKSLLTEVANRGFALFRDRMAQEAERAAARDGYLVGLGKGYVFFALENPALFHLMFGGQLSELIDVDCLQQSFGPSYQLLVDAIHRQPLTSQYDATPELDIAHAWALVHGLASLLQAKTFAPRMYGYDTVDAFATDMLRKFLGFRAAPPG
jgi:AcrR family transcriptional regulator